MLKTNRYILVVFAILLLILLIFIVSRVSKPQEIVSFNNLEEITFSNTTNSDYNANEYHTWTETTHAKYYFSYGDENEKIQWVRQTEKILSMAIEQYKMQPMLYPSQIKIYFQDDSVRNAYTGQTSAIKINPNDVHQIGALTYFISGGKLPIWLCAGLELNWLKEIDSLPIDLSTDVNMKEWASNAASKDLPIMGDEWFIPNLITDELANEDIFSVSFQFVKYLNDSKQLAKLIELYSEPQDLQEAESLRHNSWEKLTGVKTTKEDFYVFHYVLNQYFVTAFQEQFLFYVVGEQGKYYYSMADWWTYEKAKEFTDAGDSSIRYVEDWFGYQYDKLIPVSYIALDDIPKVSDQAYYGETAGILSYVSEWEGAGGIAHEVVHMFVDVFNVSTRGLEGKSNLSGLTERHFEEGLCSAIELLFSIETKNETVVKNAYKHSLGVIKLVWGKEYQLEYFERVKMSGGDVDKIDASIWADMVAIKMMEETHLEEKYAATGEKFQYLLQADVITSFILYLYKNYLTKEELMQVYDDVRRLEEICGKNLDAMIDEWLDYLNNTYKQSTVSVVNDSL